MIAREAARFRGEVAGVAWAGDFNLTPGSAIYELLVRGRLTALFERDRKSLSGQLQGPPAPGAPRAAAERSDPRRLGWDEEAIAMATGAADGAASGAPPPPPEALGGDDGFAPPPPPPPMPPAPPVVAQAIEGAADVSHDLGPLRSSFAVEPEVTSYHRRFCGTCDYILTDGGVRTTRVLEMYPLRALARTGGLPSADVPSDHVPLVCELAVGD